MRRPAASPQHRLCRSPPQPAVPDRYIAAQSLARVDILSGMRHLRRRRTRSPSPLPPSHFCNGKSASGWPALRLVLRSEDAVIGSRVPGPPSLALELHDGRYVSQPMPCCGIRNPHTSLRSTNRVADEDDGPTESSVRRLTVGHADRDARAAAGLPVRRKAILRDSSPLRGRYRASRSDAVARVVGRRGLGRR
jgi:hypothetical protein